VCTLLLSSTIRKAGVYNFLGGGLALFDAGWRGRGFRLLAFLLADLKSFRVLRLAALIGATVLDALPEGLMGFELAADSAGRWRDILAAFQAPLEELGHLGFTFFFRPTSSKAAPHHVLCDIFAAVFAALGWRRGLLAALEAALQVELGSLLAGFALLLG
jgi:hypothetical protein